MRNVRHKPCMQSNSNPCLNPPPAPGRLIVWKSFGQDDGCLFRPFRCLNGSPVGPEPRAGINLLSPNPYLTRTTPHNMGEGFDLKGGKLVV